MASIIKQRLIGAFSESAVQVANSFFSRPIPISPNWRGLRVGLRLHMSAVGNVGDQIAGGVQFAFGLCSGSSNIFGSSSVGHFVGALSSGPWSLQGSYYNNTSFLPAKKVGTVTTSASVWTQNIAIEASASFNAADRSAMFVDILRTGSSYTLNIFGLGNGPPAGTDISTSSFLAQMEMITPSLASYTFQVGGVNQTLSVTESVDGTFDSVNVSWNKSNPFIEICDIAVARLV